MRYTIDAVMRSLWTRRLPIQLTLVMTVAFATHCAMKDNSIEKLLTSLGIRIQPVTIIHSESIPLLNSDYANKAHFILLHQTKTEFKEFITAHGLEKEDILTMPDRNNRYPKPPKWWMMPNPKTAVYSKKVQQTRILALWSDEETFLFITD